MNKNEILSLLYKNFPFEPTPGQETLMQKMAIYLAVHGQPAVFMLKGYAGTGKTSFISTLVKTLPHLNMDFVLLAPTGRAAKVITGYTEAEASTIHKKIYNLRTDKSGMNQVLLKENTHENTLFIVDEASMISNNDGEGGTVFGNRNLLHDLFQYVDMGTNCMLMFVGDTAQLPPVKMNISPALDVNFMHYDLHYEVIEHELKEVVRQKDASGVLLNATALRILIGRQAKHPVMKEVGFADVQNLNSADVQEVLQNCYASASVDDTVVICRSNKNANRYNQLIRKVILENHDEIDAGDQMMVLKNNYYWLNDDPVISFVANGDVIRIKSISDVEEQYGFRFAQAQIEFVDYPHHHGISAKLLLDTINADTPALSADNNKLLFNNILETVKGKTRKAQIEKVMENDYFNALQVKYSYAITCHKAQGGQWKNVFVDQGWMPDDAYTTEHLRWLYTAITRATDNLYLINFEDRFFKK